MRHYSVAGQERLKRSQQSSDPPTVSGGGKSRHSSGGYGYAPFALTTMTTDSSMVESGPPTNDINLDDVCNMEEFCCDWLVDYGTTHPPLPKFWLIMEMKEKCVKVYFHCRLFNDLVPFYKSIVDYVSGPEYCPFRQSVPAPGPSPHLQDLSQTADEGI